MTLLQTSHHVGEAPARPPNTFEIAGQTFKLEGRILKTASLHDEWDHDIPDPEAVIRDIASLRANIDLLRFWQRMPGGHSGLNYYTEWRDIAVLRVESYRHWWEKQNNRNARRLVKWAREQGVVVEEAPLTDDVIRGLMEIFSQSPLRRGKPMRHYGKSFETVKSETAQGMEHSIFVTAYFHNELIGIVKFMHWENYGSIALILDKTEHRDKGAMNAMLAKTVEICEERKISLLDYGFWRNDTYRQFQLSNGFEKISVPQYFVPLTAAGRMALSLRLHKGPKGLLSDKWRARLIKLRARWYAFKFREKKREP